MTDAKTQKPIINPTPKQVLLASPKLLSTHRDLMQNLALVELTHMALAEFTRRVTNSAAADVVGSAANFHRIAGAHEFVEVLRSLGESYEIKQNAVSKPLDHKV
jgi:hypothetical protein